MVQECRRTIRGWDLHDSQGHVWQVALGRRDEPSTAPTNCKGARVIGTKYNSAGRAVARVTRGPSPVRCRPAYPSRMDVSDFLLIFLPPRESPFLNILI